SHPRAAPTAAGCGPAGTAGGAALGPAPAGLRGAAGAPADHAPPACRGTLAPGTGDAGQRRAGPGLYRAVGIPPDRRPAACGRGDPRRSAAAQPDAATGPG